MVRLGDIATYVNGYAFKPSDWSDNGLEIVRIQNLTKSSEDIHYYNGNINEKYMINYLDILIAWSGTLGIFDWLKGPAILNQHIFKVVFDKIDINKKYFKYAVSNILEIANHHAHGSTMKHITKKEFENLQIPLPSLERQKEIVKILDQAQMIIEKRKSQLQLLNELKHSIFYEMFGKSISNTNYFLSDVLEFIDGDRGKNYPKQADFSNHDYCLFLNTKNVTSNGFNFNKLQFISKEKDESMSKGKLQRGDIVLTTRGTLGNTAYYSKNIPFENIRINSGMVILRINRDIIFPKYLMDTIKYTTIFSKIKSGTAQKQLSISKMKKVKLYIPKLKEQEYYENIINKIEDKEHKIRNSFKDFEILRSLLATYLFSL